MRFSYRCLVARRAGGAYVVVPLSFDRWTLVANHPESALDELTLAVDDAIRRAHPGRIASFARARAGELVELELPVLPVWGASETEHRTLSLSVVLSPALRPYVEAYAPRLGQRIWLESGEDVFERAAAIFERSLRALSESTRIDLRKTGPEELATFDVTPSITKLSSLRYAELALPERRAEDVPAEESMSEEDEEDMLVEDDPVDGQDPHRAAIAQAYDEDAGFRRSSPKRGARAPASLQRATKTLRRVGDPLHEHARRGILPRAYGRATLIDTIVSRLCAARPDPLVLVGPQGAGKSAIIAEVAAQLQREELEIPPGRRLVFLVDGPRLIASGGGFGQWQQQLLDVAREAAQTGAVIALGAVIDLLDAGKSAQREDNVAQVLGPMLAARELVAIGEATPEQWAELESKSPSFARAFSVLRVEEPSAGELRAIALRVADELSARHEVTIDAAVVDACIALARRFWPYGATLGNALSFLRRAVHGRAHGRASTLDASAVIDRFAEESGVPAALLRDDRALDPAIVRAALERRVIGQRAAIERVVGVVSVIKAGLVDSKKPAAVLFFAGPTGVGKTELCRALAHFLFGSDERLVRLDMGEFTGSDAIARLIGDGQSSGVLTSAVRQQPFSVVLLDEFEKAHPAVFDVMLGVLGEGRLSDARGQHTDFRNCVLVMTSNLGADTLRARAGFDTFDARGEREAKAVRQHYLSEAESFFRPELFNRIDEFVVFDPLSLDAQRSVVLRELEKLSRREGMRRAGASLVPTTAAVDAIVREGMDTRYGARPLKRAIERLVTAPLSALLAQQQAPLFAQASSSTPRGLARGARIEIDADHRDGEAKLLLRAVQPNAGEQSSRARVSEVLALASELRAMAQRWSRSALCEALRAELRSFEQRSRLEGFWQDRAVAERAARVAASAKSLLSLVDQALEQSIASEDLAFEAYYDRSEEAAEALIEEFASLREHLFRARRALFLSTFESTTAKPISVLYLGASRASWRWLVWLRDSYTSYAKTQGLRATVYTPVEAPRDGEAKNRARGSRGKADDRVWHWREASDPPPDGAPTICAIAFRGEMARVFSAEQGAHRVMGDGATIVVKAAFECAAHDEGLRSPLEAEQRLRDDEVRRIQAGRRTVRDHRTGAEAHWQEHAGALLELTPLFEAWINVRVSSGAPAINAHL